MIMSINKLSNLDVAASISQFFQESKVSNHNTTKLLLSTFPEILIVAQQIVPLDKRYSAR